MSVFLSQPDDRAGMPDGRKLGPNKRGEAFGRNSSTGAGESPPDVLRRRAIRGREFRFSFRAGFLAAFVGAGTGFPFSIGR